jgi:hypothetical protein
MTSSQTPACSINTSLDGRPSQTRFLETYNQTSNMKTRKLKSFTTCHNYNLGDVQPAHTVRAPLSTARTSPRDLHTAPSNA